MKVCKKCKYFIDVDRYGCCTLSHLVIFNKNKEHDCPLFNKDLSQYNICYNCKYFGGGSDWGLFCSHEDMYHHLGNFNDVPCDHYIRKEEINESE